MRKNKKCKQYTHNVYIEKIIVKLRGTRSGESDTGLGKSLTGMMFLNKRPLRYLYLSAYVSVCLSRCISITISIYHLYVWMDGCK